VFVPQLPPPMLVGSVRVEALVPICETKNSMWMSLITMVALFWDLRRLGVFEMFVRV